MTQDSRNSASPGYPPGAYPPAAGPTPAGPDFAAPAAPGYDHFGQPSGYAPPAAPGYGPASQAAPGYASPGYAAPGYASPGYAAPGYAPPGYAAPGAPPGTGHAVRPPGAPPIGETVGWAWRRFRANLGPLMGLAALAMATETIVATVLMVTIGLHVNRSVDVELSLPGILTAYSHTSPSTVVAEIAFSLVMTLWNGFILTGCLKATTQEKVTFSEFFETRNLGRYLLASVALTATQNVVMFVPAAGPLLSLAASFGLVFLSLLALDRAMPLGLASVTSWKAVFSPNFGRLLGLGVVFWLIVFLGVVTAPLVVGPLIAWPLFVLGKVYTYKRTLGLPVTVN